MERGPKEGWRVGVPLLLLLLHLLLEAMGRGRKEAVERRNREEGTMIAV